MPAQFDVFLSHASADKTLVEELARRLTRANLRPWLDKWNLIPGTAWQPEIEAALAECDTCAVIIGPGGLGPWQHEEMRHAIDRRVGDRGRAFRVIPILLPGVERPERSKLPGFLVATTWVEFGETLDDPEAFHRLVCGIRGVEPGAGPGGAGFEGRCPYRGLELFDVEHAPLFFGREAMTEWLLDELKRKPSGAENRFLAIMGSSGSGKSSLARAGLLAALKDGKLNGSASWPRVICRPGSEPFFNLSNALLTAAPATVGAVVFDRFQGLKDGARALHVSSSLILGEPPRAERVVVLVDQFEELFTLCTDEAERRAFLTSLLYATTTPGGRTIVVLAMRADFYQRCAVYGDLAAAMSDHQVLVGPMNDDEIRRAVGRPARLAGLEPEPGLVELLFSDISGRPGALPLLQFALRELWDRREGHRLTLRAYREIGGLGGAIQSTADAIYDSFTDGQKRECRRILLRLIQPGDGAEETSRRVPLNEILPSDAARMEMVRAVVARLSAPEARLITERSDPPGSDPAVEIAHEALILSWPLLREWVESDRDGLRAHRQLTSAARVWQDFGRDQSDLYQGRNLQLALKLREEHLDDLNALELEFIEASYKKFIARSNPDRSDEDAESVLKRQMLLAQQVQALFLPRSDPVIPGYGFFSFYKPRLEIGGDLYAYRRLSQDRWAVAVADAVGHGIGSALFMARFEVMFQSMIHVHAIPAAVILKLNEALLGEQIDNLFVTLSLVFLDLERQTLTLASAGAQPVLIRRAGGLVDEAGAGTGGPFLGVFESMDYQQTESQLHVGDVVVMYTDGIDDTVNTENERYGRERLIRCISKENGGPEAVGRAILRDVEEFSGGAEQIDDITMVCFGPLI